MRETMIETKIHQILYLRIEESRKKDRIEGELERRKEGKLERKRKENLKITLKMLKTGKFFVDEIIEYFRFEITEIK